MALFTNNEQLTRAGKYIRRFKSSELAFILVSLSLSFASKCTLASMPLNDTGIEVCGAYPSGNVVCDGTQPLGQDANQGRDALAASGALTKVGGGSKGFDFTALDDNGNAVRPSSGTAPHACVVDNVTGLWWEVKTDDGGLRDQDWTYTWYDGAHIYGGNDSGTPSGSVRCKTLGRCDTEKYAADVNEAGLCGRHDWRMPTAKELHGISDLGRSSPNLDTEYFPNSYSVVSKFYWTSSPQASPFGSDVWRVSSAGGEVTLTTRNNQHGVRLVRSDATVYVAPASSSCSDETIPPSNPDNVYLDHGDGTVTDTRNELRWKRCTERASWDGNKCVANPTTPYFNWNEAHETARVSRFANFNDWRLPNIKELRTLVEECRYSPGINTKFFSVEVGTTLWSSSIMSNDFSAKSAHAMGTDGGVSFWTRDSLWDVRLVRAGKTLAPAQGICGTANGVFSDSAPSHNLCVVGASSEVSGSGPWTWTCSGLSGGGNASCSAPLASTRLLNIATRGKVETVDNVMIAGFIIQGSSPKKVLIRARGPSLAAAPFNVPGTLSDPFLTLYSGATPIDSNDDFALHANAAQIPADWIPASAEEAAIVTTLNPGAYTAIVNGVSGSTGVAIVEVFEIDQPGTPLINIATRGPVYTGDNVMIAGLIIQGDAPKTVLITARGPSMAGPPHNVPGTLANPTLSLYSGQTVIASNDNWPEAANAAQIQTAIGAPSNTLESAILVTLQPGAYTAIVSGAGGGTGLAIVEVFAQ